jgi:hypothetical protein
MGFKKDFFIPHVFVDEEWATPVFRNRRTNSIRIANSYAHEIDEEWIPNAIFIGRTCKYCGYKTADIKQIGVWKDNMSEKNISMLYARR